MEGIIVHGVLSTAQKLLTQLAVDEAVVLIDLSGEIKKFKAIAEDVGIVLTDAEKKCITSDMVKKWLSDLRDLMYDADDILDLYRIKFVIKASRMLSCCPIFIVNPVAAHEVVYEIKKINKKLEAINQRKSSLGLQSNIVQLVESSRTEASDAIGRRKTTSIPVNETVGERIEEDTRKLVDELRKTGYKSDANPFGIIAIVGAGGIGKTTLARKVFNYPTTKDAFASRWWAHAPQVLDPSSRITLLQSAIMLLGGSHDGPQTEEVLQWKLQEMVTGRKILVVLDDMWRVEALEEVVMAPLRSCSHGSRIIITTRNIDIARWMKAAIIHHVNKLDVEDGWALLKKEVLTPSNNEFEVEKLRDTGKQIIEKCEGLPLAIRTIGGYLRMKNTSQSDWKAVLASAVWSLNGLPEEINRAVYLSYEDLSFPLKQCFLFCALMPKGRNLYIGSMAQYWIAEGFIVEKRTSDLLEHIANDYFCELVSRNLLQPNNTDDDRCEMHDVIRAFGQYLIREDTICEGVSLNENAILERARRVVIRGNVSVPALIRKLIYVRTLMIYACGQVKLKDLTKCMLRLRILNLRRSAIDSLPDSLYCLKQLRYLNVSETNISTISPRIKKLRSLQFLILENCRRIKHLPNTITQLIELRTLSLKYSTVQSIPAGIKKLQNLVRLTGFRPWQHGALESSGLDDVATLSNLMNLNIRKLNNPVISDSFGPILRDKPYLTTVVLECKSIFDREGESAARSAGEDMSRIEDVFSKLQPPTGLKYLKIVNFFGFRLPNWLNEESVQLPHLIRLDLLELPYCRQLPSLGQLPNLKFLTISSALDIEQVGDEFLRGNNGCESLSNAFPMLERLYFTSMVKWRDWCWNEDTHGMENLQNLVIADCKLRSLPKGLSAHAHGLTGLEIVGCESLASVECLGGIKELEVNHCSKLERIAHLCTVRSITISYCPMVTLSDDLESLRTVILKDDKITELPMWLSALKNLSKLDLTCNPELLKLIKQGDNGSEWHKIKHIRQIKVSTWQGDSLTELVLEGAQDDLEEEQVDAEVPVVEMQKLGFVWMLVVSLFWLILVRLCYLLFGISFLLYSR